MSLLALFFASTLLADAPSADGDVRNLVIVTIDRVRSDHLGCYGYFRDTTTHLDALAQESLRFTRCLTPIAQTTPSHSSLFTGVAPLEHGVLSNHPGKAKGESELTMGLRTSPTLRTLAQALRARGMKTGGFVGAVPVKKFTGLDAGFEVWNEPKAMRRNGKETIAEAIKFINGCGAAPFFVWIHLFDAHGPFTPPMPPTAYFDRYHDEPALAQWLDARGFPETGRDPNGNSLTSKLANNTYDGALRFLDDQFEALKTRLDAADLRDATALVVVADHGTGLGQHSCITHGICWDEQFRVPLLIRVPGVAPRVVDAPMSTIDLWPTLFALAPGVADQSFLSQCRGTNVLASGYAPRPIFGMSAELRGLAALTAGRWKLIRAENGTKLLFDLEADPNELTNVAPEHADVVARMVQLLDGDIHRQQQSEQLHHQGAAGGETVDPAILEQLRALGYVDGAEKSDEPKKKEGDGKK